MTARPRKILVGYDGSEAAERALDAAADLAGYGSTLAVVSVARAHNGSEPTARAALDEARERLHRRQLNARYLAPAGDPAEQLVAAAETLGCDLVVVGRRHDGLSRITLGSVSTAVVRQASCDVLVVR